MDFGNREGDAGKRHPLTEVGYPHRQIAVIVVHHVKPVRLVELPREVVVFSGKEIGGQLHLFSCNLVAQKLQPFPEPTRHGKTADLFPDDDLLCGISLSRKAGHKVLIIIAQHQGKVVPDQLPQPVVEFGKLGVGGRHLCQPLHVEKRFDP